MREEKNRGKRRFDPEEARKRQELLRGFRDALQLVIRAWFKMFSST
jgi:hypothetical protein